MTILTYSRSGNKATTAVKLDKKVFGVEVTNHELLKQAYLSYMANGRENLAVTKTRGLVSGGGKKPWKQKGTGRARFGSTRNPIWRGGGIAFGPTGEENYTHKLSSYSKKQAIRQALSLAADGGKIKVIETFDCKEGRVSPTVKLLQKMGIDKKSLLVVSKKDNLVERATRNLPDIKAVQALYLNVFEVLNADNIIISQKALTIISGWLGDSTITVSSHSKAGSK